MTIRWDIRREGRAWVGNELRERWERMPEKFEVIDGRVLWSEDEQLTMLGAMLEQVGIDKAVRLGDPARWRAAIAELPA
jgi:hypothetical protein